MNDTEAKAKAIAWIETLHPVVGSFAEHKWNEYCSDYEDDLLDIVVERHCHQFYSRFEKWLRIEVEC